MIDVPLGMSAATLVEAGNYLTARLAGSFAEARASILAEIEQHRSQLDTLTQKVVSAGLATWSGNDESRDGGFLIVRGHAKLSEDVTNLADLERIRGLFEMLETRRASCAWSSSPNPPRACRSSSAARTSCSGRPAARWSSHPTAWARRAGAAPRRRRHRHDRPDPDEPPASSPWSTTPRVVGRLLGTPDTETRR